MSPKYALNVNNDLGSNGGSYTEGSVFVSSPTRTIHPFEAYLSTQSGAKQFIPIFDNQSSGIEIQSTTDSGWLQIYTLSGQLVIQTNDATLEQVKQSLPAGVYIVNGKKMIIK